ncbi:hypothetical protein [Caudoviricetes sp.]|nr:hypothetical protein [Caudoviricetes sp.]
MSKIQKDQAGNYYPAIVGKFGTTQVLTAGSASSQSSAFGTETTLVRIAASNQTGVGAHIHIKTGTNPTADSTTCALIPCGLIEYVAVSPGDKIAVLRGGGTDISLSVTEITNA